MRAKSVHTASRDRHVFVVRRALHEGPQSTFFRRHNNPADGRETEHTDFFDLAEFAADSATISTESFYATRAPVLLIYHSCCVASIPEFVDMFRRRCTLATNFAASSVTLRTIKCHGDFFLNNWLFASKSSVSEIKESCYKKFISFP